MLDNSLVGFVSIDNNKENNNNDNDNKKNRQINNCNWFVDLFVLEPFRRQGIATFLVDHALKEADNEKQKLFLCTQHDYLLPFFIKKGFILDYLVKMDNYSVFIMIKDTNVSPS